MVLAAEEISVNFPERHCFPHSETPKNRWLLLRYGPARTELRDIRIGES